MSDLNPMVSEALVRAEEGLRDALAFAARVEEPYVSKHIADLLYGVQNIRSSAEILRLLEENCGDD